MTTARQGLGAFFRGFFSGLSSISLFGDVEYTEPHKVEMRKLHRRIDDPTEVMRSDWQQVGADIQAAIDSVMPRPPIKQR